MLRDQAQVNFWMAGRRPDSIVVNAHKSILCQSCGSLIQMIGARDGDTVRCERCHLILTIRVNSVRKPPLPLQPLSALRSGEILRKVLGFTLLGVVA